MVAIDLNHRPQRDNQRLMAMGVGSVAGGAARMGEAVLRFTSAAGHVAITARDLVFNRTILLEKLKTVNPDIEVLRTIYDIPVGESVLHSIREDSSEFAEIASLHKRGLAACVLVVTSNTPEVKGLRHIIASPYEVRAARLEDYACIRRKANRVIGENYCKIERKRRSEKNALVLS